MENQQEGVTSQDDDSRRYHAAMNVLDAFVEKNPDIHDLSWSYLMAARDRNDALMDVTREPLMEALKTAGADYVQRLEILRELQAEAMQGRQRGIRDTLVKQVAERHQGR